MSAKAPKNTCFTTEDSDTKGKYSDLPDDDVQRVKLKMRSTQLDEVT